MVQTKSGETEQVTPDNFRGWKKRRGANAGFAVQLPDNNEVVLVNTISGLRKLPVGEVLQAELLQRVRVLACPGDGGEDDAAKGELWKPV